MIGGAGTVSTIRSRRAQALVEMALVLPVIVVLFFAIFDFGYYLFVMASVTQAARSGARLASMNSSDCATIKSTVRSSAVGVALDLSSISISTQANDPAFSGRPPTVIVAVNHTHKPFAQSLWSFQNLPVRSTFKSIVSTFAGRETVGFPTVGGGTCP